MASDPAKRIYESFKARYDAIDYAEEAVEKLRNENKISTHLEQALLNYLEAKRSDIDLDLRSQAVSSVATVAPTDAQVAALRQRVNDLSQWNGAASGIDDLVAAAILISQG